MSRLLPPSTPPAPPGPNRSPGLRRFVEIRHEDDPRAGLDLRIGLVLRRVPPPPPMDPGQLARVARRLHSPEARHRPGALRWALALTIVLGGGAVYARQDIVRLVSQVAGQLRAPRLAPRSPVALRQPVPAIAAAPVPPPAAAPVPPPTTIPALPPPAPTRRRAIRRARPVAADPAPRLALVPTRALPAQPAARVLVARPPSVLGQEARMIGRAVERLRRQRDPRAALASLDEHRDRFPDGLLRDDAELLRVDALLALGRRGEALILLETLPLRESPRGAELQVLRGELRAARSCPRARQDFDDLLMRSLPDAVAERALRGRAVCRMREVGDQAARPELLDYLLRFPDGPFATEATARLRSR